MSTISDPVNEIKDLLGSLNLFYSISNYDLIDSQIDLNGQMILVSYIKESNMGRIYGYGFCYSK